MPLSDETGALMTAAGIRGSVLLCLVLLLYGCGSPGPTRTESAAVEIAEVEVCPDTGVVEIAAYTVVSDFGTVLNPDLVAGQIHGGVAQGLGQALCEEYAYDADGQPLSGTFMDYAMPRADFCPAPTLEFVEEPTPTNMLGVKGCGEVPTAAASPARSESNVTTVWCSFTRTVATAQPFGSGRRQGTWLADGTDCATIRPVPEPSQYGAGRLCSTEHEVDSNDALIAAVISPIDAVRRPRGRRRAVIAAPRRRGWR